MKRQCEILLGKFLAPEVINFGIHKRESIETSRELGGFKSEFHDSETHSEQKQKIIENERVHNDLPPTKYCDGGLVWDICRPETVAIIDLDKTLLEVNSGRAFFNYLREQGKISLRTYGILGLLFLLHKLHLCSLQRAHETYLRHALMGTSMKELESQYRSFWQSHRKKLLCPMIWERVNILRSQAAFIIICSSAPEFVVRPIVEDLGLNGYFATTYRCSSDGMICAHQRIVTARLKGKFASFVRKRWKPKSLLGFGDSRDDIQFLRECDRCFIVRPDLRLMMAAKKYHWERINPD